MSKKSVEETLFLLISSGLGMRNDVMAASSVDWERIHDIATLQGVSAICFDGLQHCNLNDAISPSLKMQWIAESLWQEQMYHKQWNAAKCLGELYYKNGIDTYVMKGFSLSRLYPIPEHRFCTDMDCFLKSADAEGYTKGNRVAEAKGINVDCRYYKHSKLLLEGLTVENHQYLLPIKGSGKAKKFERGLRCWIEDGTNEKIADSRLKSTSPFFDAVYVLAHAQEHFLNEGFVLRHICDWAVVMNANADRLDWERWKCICKEYGLLSFAYAMSRLAHKVCGVRIPFDCPDDNEADRLILDDTLYKNTFQNTKRTDLQARIGLVVNMFRNNWKFRLFSDSNFLMFCGRRVWGYLFEKDLD